MTARPVTTVLSCIVALLVAVGSPTAAHADPQYRTFTGSDRYATAAMITQDAFPDGAPTVLLVKGDDFPDALAAGPLAAALGAAVVMTPSSGLTDPVRAELARLDPAGVYVIGLPDLHERQVLEVLPSLSPADIKRLRGADRYQTAALIARELASVIGAPDRVVLVAGDKFPDALSVGPLAARMGWPLLLTPQAGSLPAVTAQTIESVGATQAVRVGTYVDPGVPLAEGGDLVGLDRYDTCRMVAEYSAALGSSFSRTALATGENYPDALVAGPVLAAEAGILVLTHPTTLSGPTRTVLVDHSNQIDVLDFVGLGPAVPSAVKGSVWLPFPVEAGEADQLVTVAASGSSAVVQGWQRRIDDSWEPVSGLGPMSAFVGRNGVKADKREGDGATPAGTFTLTMAFGVAPDPGSGLPYSVPGPQTYWVSDSASPYYNTWRDYDGDGDFDPAFGERLAGSPSAYRYALVIDYNRFPVVAGAGSAIFLHVSLGTPTSGCGSLAQADVVRLLRWLDPAMHPLMALR